MYSLGSCFEDDGGGYTGATGVELVVGQGIEEVLVCGYGCGGGGV